MSEFGCRVRQKSAGAGVSSSAQFTPTMPQGPLTPLFSNVMMMRKVSGDFYESMREKIPIFDAAINRLVSMNGTIKIIGDNDKLVSELEDIALNIPVNDHQKGLNAFQANHSNEAFEQGFALGEILATPDLKDIAGLRVADSKYITFRLNEQGRTEPWIRYDEANSAQHRFPRSSGQNIMQELSRPLASPFHGVMGINGLNEVKLNPENKIYLSFNNENTDPHGVCVMRSTEFCAGVLATIQNSFRNVFGRWSDPSYHIDYKTSKKGLGPTTLEERRKELETNFARIARAKFSGHSADFVTAHDPEAEVKVTVIGADGKIIPAEIPLRHLLEQIVGRSGLPAWMLGIYWSVGERMASLEVETVLQDAKLRQFAMLPDYIRILSTALTLRGRNWKRVNITMDENKPGDWGVKFETPNLRDEVARAQARFLNAQADQMQRTAGTGLPVEITPPKPGKSAHEAGCSCGCKGADGEKELNRPTPWPELDQIESDYETKLKTGWDELCQKCLAIVGLGPMPKGVDGEAFTFSAEERKRIIDAMDDLIGEFEPVDGSPLRWYYGQSYSLGLIQAAHLVGDSRPILDIIKNREIYNELVTNGFQMLKDNATRQIVGKILPEMQAHVLAGSNPRHVADRLEKLFSEQNSNWERLARTEMSVAAEQAKLDEWKERGVNVKKGIVAGKNTHPRCRCANTVQEVDGKWILKFVPAPDACGICRAMAT